MIPHCRLEIADIETAIRIDACRAICRLFSSKPDFWDVLILAKPRPVTGLQLFGNGLRIREWTEDEE